MFDSVKRNKAASVPAIQRKLTEPQRRAIALNRAVLLVYMNKVCVVWGVCGGEGEC